MAASQQINNFESLIALAGDERWYTVPTLYMVEFVDKSGEFDGYFPALFQTKKEATDFAKKLSIEKNENTLVAKHINI